MANKKRIHFFQLSILYVAFTILVLTNAWMNEKGAATAGTMMNQSMGSMMASMHLKNIKLGDLFKQGEQSEAAVGTDSHHEKQSGSLYQLHILTTATIVILLPFIIAGTVFLAIAWIK